MVKLRATIYQGIICCQPQELLEFEMLVKDKEGADLYKPPKRLLWARGIHKFDGDEKTGFGFAA